MNIPLPDSRHDGFAVATCLGVRGLLRPIPKGCGLSGVTSQHVSGFGVCCDLPGGMNPASVTCVTSQERSETSEVGSRQPIDIIPLTILPECCIVPANRKAVLYGWNADTNAHDPLLVRGHCPCRTDCNGDAL